MERSVGVRKLIFVLVPLFLCACGYSWEEKRHIKDIAEQYREEIPFKVYEAMMGWKIEIDD